jgi:uncharacterized protein YqgV (UPF0045/DUF77 family)
MEPIRASLAILPTKQEVKNMTKLVDQAVRQFTEDNAYFKSEFETHMGIIRRFDEVLCTKASKLSLYELESKIKRELEPDIAKMYNLIKQNTEEVLQQNVRFDDYTTMMSREISNAVKKALDKKSR